MADQLTHIDDRGRARMVDVSGKPDTRRVAVAEGCVRMAPETAARIREEAMPKGDVLTVARVAGIMAAKQTHTLVPMCHSLLLLDVSVEADVREDRVDLRASVVTIGKTGAEMEALTAVSVAALTIYDMCKAVDKGMVLDGIHLVHKEGGKSDWAAQRTGE